MNARADYTVHILLQADDVSSERSPLGDYLDWFCQNAKRGSTPLEVCGSLGT